LRYLVAETCGDNRFFQCRLLERCALVVRSLVVRMPPKNPGSEDVEQCPKLAALIPVQELYINL
jgi:hypothetical protein